MLLRSKSVQHADGSAVRSQRDRNRLAMLHTYHLPEGAVVIIVISKLRLLRGFITLPYFISSTMRFPAGTTTHSARIEIVPSRKLSVFLDGYWCPGLT